MSNQLHWMGIGSGPGKNTKITDPRRMASRETVCSRSGPGGTHFMGLPRGQYSMLKDVHHIVSSCSTCAQSKVPQTLPAGKLNPLPITECLWSHIAINFLRDLLESQGNMTLLVVSDWFSNSLRLIPLPTIPSDFTTAELLFQHVFRYFGIPEEIISDRDPQFTSRVWSSFMEKLGITVSLTSGYHPQVNGQVEQANQEVRCFLQSFCAAKPEDWSRFIPWAEHTQYSLRHLATHLTPFQCVLGYQLPLFPRNTNPTDSPIVDQWFQQSEQIWEGTHQHLERATHTYKQKADRCCSEHPQY